MVLQVSFSLWSRDDTKAEIMIVLSDRCSSQTSVSYLMSVQSQQERVSTRSATCASFNKVQKAECDPSCTSVLRNTQMSVEPAERFLPILVSSPNSGHQE